MRNQEFAPGNPQPCTTIKHIYITYICYQEPKRHLSSPQAPPPNVSLSVFAPATPRFARFRSYSRTDPVSQEQQQLQAPKGAPPSPSPSL
ncbi:hypothetical protein AALO_G00206320, partial [Alosa alosa]